jgi:hypothetical protein
LILRLQTGVGGAAVDFRAIAKFLGVYGAGVVTAGFFLSAPIDRPDFLQHAPDFDPANTGASGAGSAGWVLVPPAAPFVAPLSEWNPSKSQEQAHSLAPEPPEPVPAATTGSAAGAPRQQPASASERDEQPADTQRSGNSCNYSACRRAYQSFDEATCTYQPYDGHRRELCTR